MNTTFQLKDGSPYTVRRAKEGDLEKLIQVLLEVARDDEFTSVTYPEAESQILASEERLKNLLQNEDEHFIYLIGLVDDEIIGFCDIHIGKKTRTKHVAEFGRSVVKKWRRTWAGKFLQLSAIEFVRNLKTIEKISLNISSNNTSSLKSCQSNGFKLEAGRKKEIRLGAQNYADLLTYVLYL